MLVNSQEKLNDLCLRIKGRDIIGVDTEFDRRFSYEPQLSLVQIAHHDNLFVIDVLAKLDFNPLLQILCDKEILKVWHCGMQDVEVLRCHFGINVINVFDTQIADQFQGNDKQISYADIVDKHLGFFISKDLQFSDWIERPISREHIEYAATDVKYLADIYKLLKADLFETPKWRWIIEESNSIASKTDFQPTLRDLLIKFIHCSVDEDFLLRCLNILRWREEKACSSNKLRGRVVSDKAILHALRYGNSKKIPAYILNNIHKPEDGDKDIVAQVIRYQKATHKNKKAESLKVLLQEVSDKRNIPQSLIANSKELTLYSNGYEVRFQQGWRYEVFGQNISSFLR